VSSNFAFKFRILSISLLIGIVLMLLKFAAFFLTGSNAILTDAFESIVNILAGSFALYSIWYASRPKDQDHPYGHGKIEFISAGFEGGLILVAAAAMMGKSVWGLLAPKPLENLDWGFGLTMLAGAANFGLGAYLKKAGESHNSLTLRADGQHLQSDAYSSLALLIGLGIIYFTGIDWLDNVVAIGFAVFIAWHGIQLIRQSIAGVLDEADATLLNKVVSILEKNRASNWIDIHNLRIIQYGALLHVDCHLTLPYYYTLEQAHEEVKRVEDALNEVIPKTEVFIHSDPCLPPASCKVCQLADCPFRQQALAQVVPWESANIQQNRKHHLDIES
jgi:cation diffusion facilitator family transporter